MKRSIPLVVVLVAVASTALAAPRGAGSKISGNYATFDVPAAAARTQFYGPTAPSPAAVATTPSAGERSFSYDPSAGAQSSTPVGPCQAGVAVAQPSRDQAVRSFSYEPGSEVRTYEPVPRRRSSNPAIRGADSKIKGEYRF